MATTAPPPPPAPAAPPPAGGVPPQPSRRSGAGRFVAFVVIGLLILAALFLLLGGGGGSATYSIIFNDSAQLVRGDQVQVGGVPVGSVTQITLTKDFKARVTFEVESSLAPLHQGTTAQIRQPSLSSVANRYIALSPGPNNNPEIPEGGTLPSSATKEVTDIDQLFNTLDPKTREGLKQFIQGTAEQYAGASKPFGESVEYFSPAISATDKVFAQLVKDEPTLTHFLVESAKAVTTIGARAPQLEGLIEHGNQTFQAIGSQQAALAAGLKQLPLTLHQGNVTFTNLPATLSALTALIEASRPQNKSLTTLLERLQPLATTATPVLSNFANAVSRPGPNNDLTDLALALPQLEKVLKTSAPATVTALQESVPITAFFGPYAPDLSGALRTFGQAASYYDANGHYARVSPVLPDYKVEGNTLTPTTPQAALEGLLSGQLRRCPGGATQPAADGSSPFTDNGLLSCDPLETP